MALFLLASLGLSVSLYLEYLHYSTFLRPDFRSFCSVGQSFDCVSVAASMYSSFLGVPWAIWGALGFITLAWVGVRRSVWLVPLAFGAALISVALLGVSLLLVGSVCLFCEVAHVITWAIAWLAWKTRASLRGSLKDKASLLDLLVGPTGLAVALLVFFPRYWDVYSYKGEVPFETGVTDDGHHWIGASEPQVVLHEFVDYGCGHCKIHSAHTLRSLRNHPELRVVRRQRPKIRCDRDNPKACSWVRLAYCADQQGKFWQADRWLFVHAPPGFSEPDVEGMATDLELDHKALASCLVSPEAYSFATARAKEADALKIVSTPGYVIDGQRVKLNRVKELLD